MSDLPTNIVEINQSKSVLPLQIANNPDSTEITAPINRGGNPAWHKGMTSPNPNGRPKCALVSEKLREVLKSEDTTGVTGAERLGNKLIALADQDKDGYLALAAIKEVTDRVEGKAVQNSNIRGLITFIPAEQVIDSLDSWAEDGE